MAVTLAVVPSMAVDAAVGTSAGAASAAVALPGTPSSDAYVLVTNVGNNPVYCKLGTSSAVSVTNSTGVCVMPGRSLALTIGANTYIALCTGTAGQSSTVNLATGN